MEQWERNRVHFMGVLGVFLFSLSMYTRSLYATNEIIVHLSSHGLHGLASLFWIIFDCGGRLRNGVLVRIAHDMLTTCPPRALI